MRHRVHKSAGREAHKASAVRDDLREIGDLCSETVVGPEEKTLASKGIERSGKATLTQYLALVEAGYDGDVVRRWTENHAAQQISKLRLHVRSAKQHFDEIERRRVERERLQQQANLREAEQRERRRRERQALERTWLSCPVCQAKVSTPERLTKYLAKVHP